MLWKFVSHMQKNETALSYLCTSINSKWIKDFNIRPETTELLEQNLGNHPGDYNFFWNWYHKKDNKSKNKQVGLHETKKICTVKETINEMKRQSTEWKKISANLISEKELISKIYKELILNRKQQ